jgi:hypothetical protein
MRPPNGECGANGLGLGFLFAGVLDQVDEAQGRQADGAVSGAAVRTGRGIADWRLEISEVRGEK